MGDRDSVLEFEDREARLRDLFWIADAPLFIDERLVSRFFDAVVRPKFEHVSGDAIEAEHNEKSLAGELGISAEVGLKLPEFLKPLKADVKAEGAMSADAKRQTTNSSTTHFRYIWNAERQLEELTRHYLVRYRDRIVTTRGVLQGDASSSGQKWYDLGRDFFLNVPRPMAFLDLEPGTILIPTAAEFTDGSVILLYEELVRRLTDENGGPMRNYPDDSRVEVKALREQRKTYWATFKKFFDSRRAMVVVEEASSKHGRINWIDFRMPLDDDGNTLHLHIVPAGTADAGTFAYNFVRRAYRHGVRIAGTLKSEPDLNVMAIYDR